MKTIDGKVALQFNVGSEPIYSPGVSHIHKVLILLEGRKISASYPTNFEHETFCKEDQRLRNINNSVSCRERLPYALF
jgi:hypothetical protein